MDVASALLVVVGVLAAAAAAGVAWRLATGRRRSATGEVVAADLGADRLGERATLVQFSSELCTFCPATRRLLGAIADDRPGVSHLDVDLTHRPDLARRFGVLQTPTTLVVDAGGGIRARFGGPPRAEAVARELDLVGASRG